MQREFAQARSFRAGTQNPAWKVYQIKTFFTYLERNGKHYADVKQTDVEEYLLLFNGTCRQHRQSICYTIGEFYRFIKSFENPTTKIEFKPDTSRKLFTVPSQQAIDEFFVRLSTSHLNLHLKTG
jgi:hypothetical protein